ncbi:MAG TPA: hypothetical protein VJM33_13085, partial [Microthrixaceae bacterium]|nr:hypothetical protein [Microthrixaceae bacterium]
VPGGWRVGVASIGVEDTGGDEAGIDRFEVAAKEVVAALGGRSLDVDVTPFVRAGHLLYDGVFVAERYEAVGAFVDAHPDEVDPVVGAIIRDAARHSAWEVFRDQNELARMIAGTRPVWDEIDLLVVPSVPRVPTIDEVLAEPIAVNSMLGRFTNFVNLMDLCALTVPVGPGTAAQPPPSVTLIAPAWGDELVVAAGLKIEQRSAR